jgi:hypothetical protein
MPDFFHLDTFKYLASFITILISGIFAHQFYAWYRLSHIPGPFWAAFSKYRVVSQSLNGQMHSSLKQVTDKYGQFLEQVAQLKRR